MGKVAMGSSGRLAFDDTLPNVTLGPGLIFVWILDALFLRAAVI